ncbi:hypothetical protein EXN66_Car003943 [Channa argus]|uniref:Snake toxin/toxin-like domain-containing protein n=1 Tax=Channa argus TaxID=215402 RepID=A0A6G1PD89_CHAAH|nr:hypothetical protein EXN66_Car003943 [Channa argus]KAK2917246.1 hypothetical protein Q8A73_003992 [Channa argus]
MKSFQLAVLLLLVCISSTVALKCNRCVSSPFDGKCFNTVETCQREDEVCARVISTALNRYSYFRRCMKEAEASVLKASNHYQVFTCSTDLCN